MGIQSPLARGAVLSRSEGPSRAQTRALRGPRWGHWFGGPSVTAPPPPFPSPPARRPPDQTSQRGWFSKWGSRFGAAGIRLALLQAGMPLSWKELAQRRVTYSASESLGPSLPLAGRGSRNWRVWARRRRRRRRRREGRREDEDCDRSLALGTEGQGNHNRALSAVST